MLISRAKIGPKTSFLTEDHLLKDWYPTVSISWACGKPGGADSEVWNRVYMIAPVKKFDRVRLSTIFLGRTMSFCSVISFAGSKHQEYTFSIIFLMESLDIRRRDV